MNLGRIVSIEVVLERLDGLVNERFLALDLYRAVVSVRQRSVCITDCFEGSVVVLANSAIDWHS